MVDEPRDILWEGELQGFSLDKKKIWKARTKVMQGSLIQTAPECLKLELSANFGKIVDKKSIPCNEDIDLSSIVYAKEQAGAKECNFFCQCVKENEDGEDEITVHLFRTFTEAARQSWLQSVVEFMKRKVSYRHTCSFKVAVQKVHLDESVKLFGEYTLRASKNEIEFMIAENIPGVRFSHEEVSSIKLLQDTSMEGAKHVFDLIMLGKGGKHNQHIVITANGGFLLLAYLQRGNSKLVEDILELRDFTHSLPLSPLPKRTPPIPPKPEEEDKPPLPPRVPNDTRGTTLDYRRMRGINNLDDWSDNPPLPPRNDTITSPNVPPRNDTIPSSPTVPPRGIDWNKKGMTLPHKMRLKNRTSDLVVPKPQPSPRSKLDIQDTELPLPPIPRVKMDIPDISEIPTECLQPRRGSRGLTEREPMPTPAEVTIQKPNLLALKVEQQEPPSNPRYIQVDFSDKPTGKEPFHSPEDPGYATVTFPENEYMSMETPITELVDENTFSNAMTDEGGYLQLLNFDGNVDSGGYLTILESHDPPDVPQCPNSPLKTPKETESPMVPPRTYRQFLNH